MTRLRALVVGFAVVIAMLCALAIPSTASAQGQDGTGLGPAEVRELRLELSAALAMALNARGEAGAAERRAAASRADLVRVGVLLGLRPDAPFEDVLTVAARWVEQDVDTRKQLVDMTEIVRRIENGEIRDRAAHSMEVAQAAFEDGRFEDADLALAALESLRRGTQTEARELWAEAVLARSRLADQRLDGDTARRLVRKAREEERALSNQVQLQYVWREANSYELQEDVRPDNGNSLKIIALYRNEALPLVDRFRQPDHWAKTQNWLGIALYSYGLRENQTARMEEAVEAYRAALDAQPRQLAPMAWAETQNNLGLVLRTLGDRENRPARLQDAIDAHRSALEEITRAQNPLDWAGTQSNLGSALMTLGRRESGTALLEQAVTAQQAALEEFISQGALVDAAATHNNLGNALLTLGAREVGRSRLDQAILAFGAALERDHFRRKRILRFGCSTDFHDCLIHDSPLGWLPRLQRSG